MPTITRRNSTAASAALYERALAVMPGGSTRATLFVAPHPPYAVKGIGARVIDADGHSYLDFVNNFFSQIHGHSHPDIVAAVIRQASEGLSFGLPTESEILLAEEICRRSPVLEQIRFCNSGSEAIMTAIKAARAYTGRPKIAKIEGAYHGSYDHVEVSLDPNPTNWGPPDQPAAIPYAAGTPPGILADTIILPFEDPDAAAALIIRHAADLAAVVIDPVPSRAGMIAAQPALLQRIREVTQAHGILMLCDEIITFRLGWHGAHSLFGFAPDLVTLGKVIGGGQPIGAIAGRREVMAVFDVTGGHARLSHGGTFSANPLTMAAGLAGMKLLTPDAYAKLDRLGTRLRTGLTGIFQHHALKMQVSGVGSLFRMHMTDRPITGYRSAYPTPEERRQLSALRLFFQENGILLTPNCSGALSTVMTDADIDQFIATMEQAVAHHVM